MNVTNPKKTVLIVTFPQGGPFVWAQNLAKELERKNYSIEIVTGRWQYFLAMFRRCDVLHTCVPLPFSLAKKYVLTIHGNYQEEKAVARPLFRRAIKRAEMITVPSEYLKKILHIPSAKVIPNGINPPSKKKESYTLIDTYPAVGILTNFNFRRKADGLLYLTKIVHSISSNIQLIIGGSGTSFDEYQKTILAIHPNTKFLGHCHKEDLFFKIDVFTYYSNQDNQPIAILESMAAGLPVLSNQIGAVLEILNGKLEKYVSETDTAYQRTLQTLLESEESRRDNGSTGIRRSQEFLWEKIIAQYIEIYGK